MASVMSQLRARELAESWIAAWNNRDLEALMSHYSDEVVFISPTVLTRDDQPSGVIRGRKALREHFGDGLKKFGANVRFTLLDVCAGVNGFAIYYSRETGAKVIGAKLVDASGKIVEVRVHYHAAQQRLAGDAPQAARS